MVTVLVLLLCLGAFLVLLSLFWTIKLEIIYKKEGRDDRLAVAVLTGLPFLTYRFTASTVEWVDLFSRRPKIKARAKARRAFLPWGWRDMVQVTLPDAIRKGLPYRGVGLYTFKKVKIFKLKSRTEIGFADPAVTGMLVGLLWGAQGTLMSVMQQIKGSLIAKPQLEVVPDFARAHLRLDFHGIFGLRLGHIIIAGGKSLFVFIKQRRGRHGRPSH